MKTILTHQSAYHQGEDVLIINGEKNEYSGAQTQIDALKQILQASDTIYEKGIPSIFRNTGTSPSLKIYITESKTLVVSSNFQSKDDNGRIVSYNYYCDSIDDPDRVVRTLADDCRIAGMTPNPADIKTLNTYLKFHKNRVRYYAIMGTAALVVLFVLFKIIF